MKQKVVSKHALSPDRTMKHIEFYGQEYLVSSSVARSFYRNGSLADCPTPLTPFWTGLGADEGEDHNIKH